MSAAMVYTEKYPSKAVDVESILGSGSPLDCDDVVLEKLQKELVGIFPAHAAGSEAARRDAKKVCELWGQIFRKNIQAEIDGCHFPKFLDTDLCSELWQFLKTVKPKIVKHGPYKANVTSRPKYIWGIANDAGEYPLYGWGQSKADYSLMADMNPLLLRVAALLEDKFSHPRGFLNLAMATFYWNGKDQHIVPHQDKAVSKESTGKVENTAPIYNLSLGAVRPFIITKLALLKAWGKDRALDIAPYVLKAIPMHEGDLVRLSPKLNMETAHMVPKDPSITELRISLVFRHCDKRYVKLGEYHYDMVRRGKRNNKRWVPDKRQSLLGHKRMDEDPLPLSTSDSSTCSTGASANSGGSPSTSTGTSNDATHIPVAFGTRERWSGKRRERFGRSFKLSVLLRRLARLPACKPCFPESIQLRWHHGPPNKGQVLVAKQLFKFGLFELRPGEPAIFHSIPRKNVYLVWIHGLATWICALPRLFRATSDTQRVPEPERDDVDSAMDIFDTLSSKEAAERSRQRRAEKARYERRLSLQTPSSPVRCVSVLDGDRSKQCSRRKLQGSDFCAYHQDRPNFATRIDEFFKECEQSAAPVTEQGFYSWVGVTFPFAKQAFSPIDDFPKFINCKAKSAGYSVDIPTGLVRAVQLTKEHVQDDAANETQRKPTDEDSDSNTIATAASASDFRM